MAKVAEKKEEAPAVAVAPPQPMFSKMGQIVFGVTMLFMFGLFTTFIMLTRTPPAGIVEQKIEPPMLNVKDLTAPKIEITGKDSIIISIPTTAHATEFRHLKVSLTLQIGRVEGEGGPGFSIDTVLASEQFLDTAIMLVPTIKHLSITLLSSYGYLQLQEQTYKTEFLQRLKEAVNAKLESYGMKPRIVDVLLGEFIFSD